MGCAMRGWGVWTKGSLAQGVSASLQPACLLGCPCSWAGQEQRTCSDSSGLVLVQRGGLTSSSHEVCCDLDAGLPLAGASLARAVSGASLGGRSHGRPRLLIEMTFLE